MSNFTPCSVSRLYNRMFSTVTEAVCIVYGFSFQANFSVCCDLAAMGFVSASSFVSHSLSLVISSFCNPSFSVSLSRFSGFQGLGLT